MDVSYHIAQYTNIIAELREEVNRLRVRLDAANKKPVSEQLIRGGNPQLDKLKEQLLDVFREQMDLRWAIPDDPYDSTAYHLCFCKLLGISAFFNEKWT